MISLADLSLLINGTTIHPGVHLRFLSKFFSVCLLNVSQIYPPLFISSINTLAEATSTSYLNYFWSFLTHLLACMSPSSIHSPFIQWPGIIFQKYKYYDVTVLKILQWFLSFSESKFKSTSWPTRPWSDIILPCQPHLAPRCLLLWRVGF